MRSILDVLASARLPRAPSPRALAALLLVLLVPSCSGGDGEGGPAPPGGDVPADTSSPDAAAPSDIADAVEDVAPPPPDETSPPPPPPLAPEDVRTPVPIGTWMVTSLITSDPLMALLDAGTFVMPAEGTDQGAYWTKIATGENGSFTIPGTGMLFYAAAEITLPEASAAIVRADGVYTVFASGARQPGDVYQTGRHRVPIRLEAGKNLVVVRGARRSKAPEVQVETSTHELVFNLLDLVVPDLEADPPHEQWLGVPVLNTSGVLAVDVTARVLLSDQLGETEAKLPSLAPKSVVQVPFRLTPKPGFVATGEPLLATVHVESPSLGYAYECVVEIPTRMPEAGAVVRRTFLSKIDRSAQHYAVREPTLVEAGKEYAMAMALHGAGVGLTGMAQAYSAKDWLYVVAPTNRRPFGFDWEAWGRLDGLEVLDLVQSSLSIDPARVFLTGHSMGGHGTWQLGVLFPGRFAVVAPSAGWISFATYASAEPFPPAPFGWASSSSDTLKYVTNLRRRAVYGIHGTADDNVPVGQLQTMVQKLEPIVDDLHVHYEEGAGHWWDGDASPGADCVDWPPLFELMAQRTLDPLELDFDFVSPGPGVSSRHSYVSVRSAFTPANVTVVESAREGDVVTLETNNVRGMVLDGAGLLAKGIAKAMVDGKEHAVTAGPIEVGDLTGKTPETYGPFIQVFQQPFCLVWDDAGPAEYVEFASLMLSTWNMIGNGTGCALPMSALTEPIRAEHNIVYLGVPADAVPLPEGMPLHWDELAVTVSAHSFEAALLAFVFPEGKRLGAVMVTTRTHEAMLHRMVPFSSRFFVPDWIVLGAEGGYQAAGFFYPDWSFTPKLSFPSGFF